MKPLTFPGKTAYWPNIFIVMKIFLGFWWSYANIARIAAWLLYLVGHVLNCKSGVAQTRWGHSRGGMSKVLLWMVRKKWEVAFDLTQLAHFE